MSNAFTNFLSGVASGILGKSDGDLRDYQHADRLYVKNNYARAPKAGFLYFVDFDINRAAIPDATYREKGIKDVGLLVKRAELPKFKITNETLNQYNRKTVVQTKITYSSVNIDFHDDNSDITNNLWKNYYNYYYMDGVYGQVKEGLVPEFADTKFGTKDYSYGLDNFQNQPFFNNINIYVLHQHKFTQFILINPKISDWTHDAVEQGESNKFLANKMTVDYEGVSYKQGKIVRNKQPHGWLPVYYDNTPSPLRTGAGGLLGAIAGADAIFGEDGSLANAKTPLDYLGVALQSRDLYKNVRQLTKGGLRQEGYSILSGVLGNIASTGNQPGGVRDDINRGINMIIPSSQNSVSPSTLATPVVPGSGR